MIPAALKRRIPDTVNRILYLQFPRGTPTEVMSRVTLRQINALIRDSVKDPLVQQTAHQILQRAGVDRSDTAGAIRAVHAWIQSRFRYEYDPGSIEMITRPREAIQAIQRHGRYDEDCDGLVVTEMSLLGVLLGTHNVRTTIIKADKRVPAQWSHIYMQVRVGRKWVTLDPIMQGEDPKRPLKPIGWEAPKFFARERIPVGAGPGMELTAQRDGLKVYERGAGMGRWIPAQTGQSARGNAMAYEDDTWFDRLPEIADQPQPDPPNLYGMGAVMSHQYAQRSLVKGGVREAEEGIGAILSASYAQSAVPGYRPTTVGEDPQVAAGTPYWEAPGTVGGTMRAQRDKTALMGVADYIQLGQEPSPWGTVAQQVLEATATIAQTEQLMALNRERIKAGLPPIDPATIRRGSEGARRAAAGNMTKIGIAAAVVLGGAFLWSMTRRRKRSA